MLYLILQGELHKEILDIQKKISRVKIDLLNKKSMDGENNHKLIEDLDNQIVKYETFYQYHFSNLTTISSYLNAKLALFLAILSILISCLSFLNLKITSDDSNSKNLFDRDSVITIDKKLDMHHN